MIDAKTAATNASQYLKELLPEPIYSLRLEEVELSEDERYWHITLGYAENPFGGPRNYKIFKIDANTARVISMKIRKA
jgi:hypothetical protein